MKRIIHLACLGMLLMLATEARAASITMLPLVGEAPKGTDVSALWKGETMADGVADNSRHFELDVPMGADMPYHPGDRMEIDVDGKPSGRITLGDGSGPQHIVLSKRSR